MAQNKLILRKLTSPYTGQFTDSTKGSILSHAELDGNQIFLKGELIYTAQTSTSGATIIFPQIKGTQFEVDINPAVSGADVTITGMSFNEITFDLDLYRNDGTVYTENLARLASDVFVMSGEYNPNDGTIDFTYNSGQTFSVSGFTTGMTNYYTTEARLSGSTIYFDRTDATEIYSVDIGPIISANTLYTNAFPMPVDVGGWDASSTFSAQTIQQMWDGLLYPYQYPVITVFNRADLKTEYEIGEGLSISDREFTWTISNDFNIVDNQAGSIELEELQPVLTIGDSLDHDGTHIVSGLTNDMIFTTTGNRNIYRVSAKNTKGETITRNISKTWKVKWYYGKNINTSITSAQMTGLTGNDLVTSVTNGFVNVPVTGAGEYPYLCIPDTLGQPTDLRDSVSGCFGTNHPFIQLPDITINNAFGVSVTYNVYRFVNKTAGSVNIWMCN